jgi:hypothetical protein
MGIGPWFPTASKEEDPAPLNTAETLVERIEKIA